MYNTYLPKIRTWAEDDRPRDKFIMKGAKSISDSELIAIFLNSGLANKSAIDLAKEILALVENDIQKLDNLNIHDLLKVKGVGKAKAITLLAVLEFCKRKKLKNNNEKIKIKCSNDIYNFFKSKFYNKNQEEFHVVMFNSQREIIDSKCISIGNIDKTLVDIRILLKYCIACYSCSFAIAHNHPSGSLIPSENDKKLTESIYQASKILSLTLVDHLIVTNESYYSFFDNNLLY